MRFFTDEFTFEGEVHGFHDFSTPIQIGWTYYPEDPGDDIFAPEPAMVSITDVRVNGRDFMSFFVELFDVEMICDELLFMSEKML